MKKLLLFSLLSLSLVSCSSMKDKFNDAKVDVSKEAKEFVTKELKSECSAVVVEGVNCESEYEEIGLNVETELLKFLKAEQKVAAMSDKSLTSEVLPAACEFVSGTVVPYLVGQIHTKYVCVRACGSEKLVEVGKDLCGLLKK